MKKIVRISLLLLSVISISSCVNVFSLSDLRTEALKENKGSNPNKAKQLLSEMGKAHGIEYWNTIDTYNITFKEEFYGFLGKFSHPFKESDLTFSLSYIPKTYNGQFEFLTGEQKGTVWGIQDWQTYEKKGDQILKDEDKEKKFWIPTYQYFIEFPSRIQEATAVDYMGQKVIDGITAEGVIASWGTVEPQKELDQYVVWINAETKQIIKIDYTIRDVNKFVVGVAYFKDYKNYNGLLLPSEFPVKSNLLKDGFLHKMSIKDFTINPVSKESLMPIK